MLSEQLRQDALALPLSERVALAEALWQSIDVASESDAADEERAAIEQAKKRDAELTSGAVVGRTHDQVMETARRVLECG